MSAATPRERIEQVLAEVFGFSHHEDRVRIHTAADRILAALRPIEQPSQQEPYKCPDCGRSAEEIFNCGPCMKWRAAALERPAAEREPCPLCHWQEGHATHCPAAVPEESEPEPRVCRGRPPTLRDLMEDEPAPPVPATLVERLWEFDREINAGINGEGSPERPGGQDSCTIREAADALERSEGRAKALEELVAALDEQMEALEAWEVMQRTQWDNLGTSGWNAAEARAQASVAKVEAARRAATGERET